MSAYRYLNCDKCKEYIHLGKVGGSDFEVDFKTLEHFLDKHAEHKGCSLSTLTDAVESQYYCKVMKGTEFKSDEQIIGYAGEDIKEGDIINKHVDGNWYNKNPKTDLNQHQN